MFKRLWKDPVLSSVIATIIMAFGTYVFNLWPLIKKFLISAYIYLGKSTEMLNWIIGLMLICTILVIIVLGIFLWQLVFQSSSGVTWTSYKEDMFFNIKWGWSYNSDGSIYNLHSLCPQCSYQIYPVNASGYHAVSRIEFRCDSCGATYGPYDEDQESLENKVERSIHQKIRTDEWKGT